MVLERLGSARLGWKWGDGHASPPLAEPLGLQIRDGRWYLLANFLYQN